jgi:hypothetical protein
MARVQAEQLAAMLETLPRSIGPAAAANIRADNGETRALLQQLGVSVAPSAADDLDALVRENSGLKARARELAAELRGRADEESKRRLVELQRHLLRSLKRELGGKGADETDFATLTAKDSAARRKE